MLDDAEIRQAATNIRQLGDYLLFSAGSNEDIRRAGVDLVATSVRLRDSIGKDAA